MPLQESVKERAGQIFSPEPPGAEQLQTFQQRCLPQRVSHQLRVRTWVVILYDLVNLRHLNNLTTPRSGPVPLLVTTQEASF